MSDDKQTCYVTFSPLDAMKFAKLMREDPEEAKLTLTEIVLDYLERKNELSRQNNDE